MTTRHAASTFDIDTWDDQPWDEGEGAKLTRLRLTKTFHGDVEGTSAVEGLTAVASGGDGRAYVALERITGRVHGRRGSFVLHHTALDSSAGQQTAWTVVPGTGTGELRGLRGTGEIVVEPGGQHRFMLDYELD